MNEELGLLKQATIAPLGPPPIPSTLETALVDYRELLTLDLPERKHYLAWLSEGSLDMVFGPRGVGKTMFQLGLGAALVTGQPFLRWPVPEPVGVLYIDGEMPIEEIRSRMTALLPAPPMAPLYLLSGDILYRRAEEDLVLTRETTREDLLRLLDAHHEIRVVIIDNVSCLFPGLDEDKKRDWEPVAAWLVTLRRRGLAVVLVHHSGKGGQQRGTSGREDSLDCVIQLSRPVEYDAREGCHFELQFTKTRGVRGEAVTPMEVRVEDVNGKPTFSWSTLEKSKEDQARALIHDGVDSLADLADALGVTRGYACKLKQRILQGAP